MIAMAALEHCNLALGIRAIQLVIAYVEMRFVLPRTTHFLFRVHPSRYHDGGVRQK